MGDDVLKKLLEFPGSRILADWIVQPLHNLKRQIVGAATERGSTSSATNLPCPKWGADDFLRHLVLDRLREGLPLNGQLFACLVALSIPISRSSWGLPFWDHPLERLVSYMGSGLTCAVVLSGRWSGIFDPVVRRGRRCAVTACAAPSRGVRSLLG